MHRITVGIYGFPNRLRITRIALLAALVVLLAGCDTNSSGLLPVTPVALPLSVLPALVEAFRA